MRLWWVVLAAGCTRPPAPIAADAWSNDGPGLGATQFDAQALLTRCAVLDGGPEDVDHHNLVGMHNGYLVLPWAPEEGGGGISFFDVSDPCSPIEVGRGFSEFMRESHTLSFGTVDGRDYLAVDYIADGGRIGGVGFWDVTDPTAPFWASELALDGFVYPDSYTRLTLSTFWQGPYLYVSGAFNGVYVVDVSDPLNPSAVAQFNLEPPTSVGTVHVVGTRALISSSGLARTAIVDVSDPLQPAPVAGADWSTEDANGDPRPFYFANLLGQYAVYARNGRAGGPIVYDLSDPDAPEWQGDAESGDEGGYAMRHEDVVFIGDSEAGRLYDLNNDLALIGELALQGDLDTVTPVGNVLVASVDEGGVPGEGSVIMPWKTAPDTRGPVLELAIPADGDTFVATTARIGLSYNEAIARRSVHPGSVRLTDAKGFAVDAAFHVQEGIVNISPTLPLLRDSEYRVEVAAGGVSDVSGNAVDDSVIWGFTTEP